MVHQRGVVISLGVCAAVACIGLGASSVFAQDAASRLPIPPEEAQAKARQFVDQLFERDFAAAKTPAEKTALFRKLVEEAEKAKDDPAGRFILLTAARDLAARAGEIELAIEAIDELAEIYAAIALAMKEELVIAAGRATKDPGQFAMIADRAVGFIEEAVAEDDYERAGRFGKLATAAAKRAKDTKLVKAIVVRLKELKGQQDLFEEAKTARDALAKDARDADANLTVGRFLCFVKGDWQTGLRHLAQGSNKELQRLSAKEAQKNLSAADQVAVADGWWAIAEEMQGRSRDQVLLHAGSWYRRALAGMPDTLAKRRVEQRLAEIASIKPLAPPRSSLPKLITNSIGMKLVLIRAGEFLMGSTPAEIEQYTKASNEFKLDPQDKRHEDLKRWYNPGAIRHEAPQHRVRITKPFYFGIYEVTQAEYEAVAKKNPSYKYFPKNRAGKDTSRHPVDFVPGDDAVKFCRALSELPAEKEAGRVYRLPTEAEWEYACRAGSKGAYYFRDDQTKLGDNAWFAENAELQTHPVGEKAPNAWGLCDMLGNATEWCADAWIVDYYAQSPRDDPVTPAENQFRMRRGGSFWHPMQMCRCAYRLIYAGGGYDSGFRVVCTTPEIAQLRRASSKPEPRGR